MSPAKPPAKAFLIAAAGVTASAPADDDEGVWEGVDEGVSDDADDGVFLSPASPPAKAFLMAAAGVTTPPPTEEDGVVADLSGLGVGRRGDGLVDEGAGELLVALAALLLAVVLRSFALAI